MLRTYKALLNGDRIEWIDHPAASSQPVPVHVTLLEDASEPAIARGREMAQALEAVAEAGGLTAITDPVAWQREQRLDRSLPRREE